MKPSEYIELYRALVAEWTAESEKDYRQDLEADKPDLETVIKLHKEGEITKEEFIERLWEIQSKISEYGLFYRERSFEMLRPKYEAKIRELDDRYAREADYSKTDTEMS